VFFDGHGKPLRPKVAGRLVTIDAESLAAIPEVVAVASGAPKGSAVRAALEGHLVQGLVVDHELPRRCSRTDLRRALASVSAPLVAPSDTPGPLRSGGDLWHGRGRL
jgi:hypothetical protein